MSTNHNQEIDIADVTPSIGATGFFLILIAALAGSFTALYVLPDWIPGLSASMSGTDPKFYWYLARGSAFTAYLLLWLSMVLGVSVSNKLSAFWIGLPPAIDLHQYSSILGLVFAAFHGLILLGDRYIGFRFFQIILPFSTESFKPLVVGFGQLSSYFWIFIILSFYLRRKIGSKAWRVIHFSSYVMFGFALLHGVTGGTDTSSSWAQVIYWSTGLILLLLTIYRIIFSIKKTAKMKEKQKNPNLSS